MAQQWLTPLEDFIRLPELSKDGNPVYYHTASNATVESRTIRINERDFDNAYDVYQWRFSTEYPILKAYHGNLYGETRDGVKINVFVEKIDYLVEQLRFLTLSQCLYILKTSMVGLEKLIEKFGFFDITSKMIGITRSKECKVWLNEDLCAFTKNTEATNEETLIPKLLGLLEMRTENNSVTRNFYQRAYRESSSFIRAQNFINQFAFEQDLVLPNLFLENNRRRSIDPKMFMQLNKRGTEYRSFIQNNEFIRNSGNQSICPNERTSRKTTERNPNQSIIKSSFLKSNSNTPTRVSFTYKNKDSQILRSPASNQSLYRRLKTSEQTMATSTEQAGSKLLSESQSYPYLQFLPKYSKQSTISLNQDYPMLSKRQQDPKRMSIMSTLSLKIRSDRSIGEPPHSSQNRLASYRKTDESIEYDDEVVQHLFNENFQKNQWKKTVSQLFSSEKNLKESMSYGEQEKAYLKDLELKHLDKFGRFIYTSVLERDEEEQNEMCNEFLSYAT